MCGLFGDSGFVDDLGPFRWLVDSRLVRWALAHRLATVKFLLFYFFFCMFGLMSFVMAASQVFLGLPFANPTLSDIGFHLARARDLSLAPNIVDYYSPLFHVLLHAVSVGRGPELALCAVGPLLVYFALPSVFYFFAKAYHRSEGKAIDRKSVV